MEYLFCYMYKLTSLPILFCLIKSENVSVIWKFQWINHTFTVNLGYMEIDPTQGEITPNIMIFDFL